MCYVYIYIYIYKHGAGERSEACPRRETGRGGWAKWGMATVARRSADARNVRSPLWKIQLRPLNFESFDSFEATCTSFHTHRAVPPLSIPHLSLLRRQDSLDLLEVDGVNDIRFRGLRPDLPKDCNGKLGVCVEVGSMAYGSIESVGRWLK